LAVGGRVQCSWANFTGHPVEATDACVRGRSVATHAVVGFDTGGGGEGGGANGGNDQDGGEFHFFGLI